MKKLYILALSLCIASSALIQSSSTDATEEPSYSRTNSFDPAAISYSNANNNGERTFDGGRILNGIKERVQQIQQKTQSYNSNYDISAALSSLSQKINSLSNTDKQKIEAIMQELKDVFINFVRLNRITQ